jgi:predicted regulator of Ras-like GTPase activity (Roadblock/LC7/MglB family)
LIIVVDQASLNYDAEFDQSLGAISASILAFAQNGISMLNDLQDVKSLIIQAGYEIDNESFTIIIESIGQDIILMSIFPSSLKTSLILFELKHINQKLLKIFHSEEQTGINAKISSTI